MPWGDVNEACEETLIAEENHAEGWGNTEMGKCSAIGHQTSTGGHCHSSAQYLLSPIPDCSASFPNSLRRHLDMASYNHGPISYSFMARQLQCNCSQLSTCQRAGHCGAGQMISQWCLQQRGKNCPQCRDVYPSLSIPVNPMGDGREQSGLWQALL